jgi:sec-independent protein translocase protein TatA
MLGSTEIIVIAAVVLVLFGGTAIPKFFRSLGKAKREFQKGLTEEDPPNGKGDA